MRLPTSIFLTIGAGSTFVIIGEYLRFRSTACSFALTGRLCLHHSEKAYLTSTITEPRSSSPARDHLEGVIKAHNRWRFSFLLAFIVDFLGVPTSGPYA
ncbi:uncharacterized protein SCHCODRAFT_02616932 [Schizophyllum commune H4-8]|uniref:uncharacterized protein n=1 Tax=Schizophyllum commune (strain H4-8 / FGSC 9210) TaxID=578458 RepID=UPI00215FBE20|nr:uncharacterized protein SCHCODRAFT_02616932 [Schizophyllum commune H4-8]KAI5897217.1 hypothetical protein SCHCODRAFT_02616932 [Schizophyllum commune H4-8]